jgi:vitamin B12/bleomycin/antimicrobial peptide transport system ATP-binding/permease protein
VGTAHTSLATPVRFRAALWRLLRPYWTSSDRWRGGALLVAIIALVLAAVFINVKFNTWNGDFYNAIQDKKYEDFKRLLLVFTGWAFLSIVVAVYRIYLMQMLQMRWRRWLTEMYLAKWMQDAVHYRLSMVPNAPDNPDQRIAEDFKMFVDDSLSLLTGLIDATVTLVSFVGLLWVLSGSYTLPASLGGITIPGYMVWVALVYALLGSVLAHYIGRALISLNVQRQQHEADFRYALVRARENAESIAIYRGGADELAGFRERFGKVVDNWWQIMKRQKQFAWFSNFYAQLAVIFPFFVGAPRYFSGAIQLGQLMQIASAFGQVQSALSWFIDAYGRIASWRAAMVRLDGLVTSMDAAAQLRADLVVTTVAANAPLALRDLALGLPGRSVSAIVSPDGFAIAPGQHTLITGPSGSGKSTLLRTMSGIWPFASGQACLPPMEDCLFLSQRAYLPLGSLKHVLSFPANSRGANFSDAQLSDTLRAVGLEALAARLHEEAPWAQLLSGGEQQRLCIARALLQKPTWLFLDEATSALDEALEARMYGLLREHLVSTTLVSVAHRPGVARFHQQRIRVDSSEQPACLRVEPI